MISSGVQLLIPILAQFLINSFKHHIDYWLIVGIVGMLVVTAILSAASGTILGIFGENVVANLRKELWKKVINLPVKYFDLVKSGDLASRLSNDTTQVKDLIANTFPSAFSSMLLILGSIVMMLIMDWKMTIIIFFCLPILLLVLLPLIHFGQQIGRLRQSKLADFNAAVSESMSEIRLVKSSNAENEERTKGDKMVDDLNKIGRQEAVYDSIFPPFLTTVLMFLILGIMVYGVHRVSKGTMTFGMLTSFVLYLCNFVASIPVVTNLFSQTAKVAGSTDRISNILEETSEEFEQGLKFDIDGEILAAKNITFSYLKNEPVINNISFEAKPNTIIAFVGPSGGGKSTIFSLIERFYDVDTGEILIGEHNINEINLENWREQIGIVGQDSPLMAGTIRDNLIYGLKGSYSDHKLWEILKLAYADQFVSAMPRQLNTEVGERGVTLSGGQRQRIAIARAFLRDPKILMLDEATASLDSESEAKIQVALNELMKGRTTLVIAHRLATIVDSNNIYFVEHGKITGSGTHEELLKTHALYKQYVSEQFKQ
ncbi:multidrug resistance ABC transporter ATP-binding and permease protein [Xylocopilactobacillus apis]|uniref:Multidrug resistance ABC transporter ATP-binding and permease protein n=2 Tax=Xylocopilactobacillus apis TaxID=2932183 RepID=A0AAU9D8Q2_9LACO|nr:multidrug resistance ABC transporter ATP-binding and permease protein [Xylocopilactobacillus apis]